MRIIAGEFRGRHLQSPPDAETTRPIPARVRESLCGLFRGQIEEGAAVFDGFAGTGSFGLEALSRGASRCVFVERDRRIFSILRENVRRLGLEDRAELVCGDALGPGALARCPRPVTLALLDPPYELVQHPMGWSRVRMQMERLAAVLADDGFALVRTPWPLRHETGRRPVEDPDAEIRTRPVWTDADLAIGGAVGPETHVYRSTAAHLYMRHRA